ERDADDPWPRLARGDVPAFDDGIRAFTMADEQTFPIGAEAPIVELLLSISLRLKLQRGSFEVDDGDLRELGGSLSQSQPRSQLGNPAFAEGSVGLDKSCMRDSKPAVREHVKEARRRIARPTIPRTRQRDLAQGLAIREVQQL